MVRPEYKDEYRPTLLKTWSGHSSEQGEVHHKPTAVQSRWRSSQKVSGPVSPPFWQTASPQGGVRTHIRRSKQNCTMNARSIPTTSVRQEQRPLTILPQTREDSTNLCACHQVRHYSGDLPLCPQPLKGLMHSHCRSKATLGRRIPLKITHDSLSN